MIDTSFFERLLPLYAQPIAYSCGRICRAQTAPEQLDAILKCAEIIARYTALISINSWAARDDSTANLAGLDQFTGSLSFGHFWTAVQVVAKAPSAHPVKVFYGNTFISKKAQSNGDDSMVALITLRNQQGHALSTLSDVKARLIFDNDHPHIHLQKVLESLKELLQLPLFLMDNQTFEQGSIVANYLWLMGESADPLPQRASLSSHFQRSPCIYLGLPGGSISLTPWLEWNVIHNRQTKGIYIIHRITEEKKRLEYVSVWNDAHEDSKLYALAEQCVNQTLQPLEPPQFADGHSFYRIWSERRVIIEQSASEQISSIPWEEFDSTTLSWYSKRLGATSDSTIRNIICDKLLDGRTRLRPAEIRQLRLLFGSRATVATYIGREILDCRIRGTSEERVDPSKRQIIKTNILEALRVAVDFLRQNISSDATGLTIDGLQATSGSADYIALREALVNLCIHQDYDDQRTVAQIELTPQTTRFFNAGKSLVNQQTLTEGGKSQSRNPLISRAFRLIGFAELAGSGIRTLTNEWQRARRPAPTIESDDKGNTFSIFFDWQAAPQSTGLSAVARKVWLTNLGLAVTENESTILLLALDPEGTTIEALALSLDVSQDDVKQVLERLRMNRIVSNEGPTITISRHLRDKVRHISDELNKLPK
jgi:hypothetical protein